MTVLGFVLFAAAAAAVTPVPRNLEPIDVKAAHSVLELKGVHRHASLSGAVVAKQGDVTMRAPMVEATYAPGTAGIETMVAVQGVEVTQGDKIAKADRAEFDNALHTITLTGEPRVWDGDNLVQGTKIVLHVDDERVECFECSADVDPDTIKQIRPDGK